MLHSNVKQGQHEGGNHAMLVTNIVSVTGLVFTTLFYHCFFSNCINLGVHFLIFENPSRQGVIQLRFFTFEA